MSTEQKTIDTFFMTVVGLFGAIFSGLSFDVLNGLDGNCPSVWTKNGWTGILALGGCMIVASIMFFSCVYMGSGSCYQNLGIRRSEQMYIGLLMLIALACIGIGTAILVDSKKLKSDYICNAQKSKKYAVVIIVMSSIIVLLSIVGLSFIKKPEVEDDYEEDEGEDGSRESPFDLTQDEQPRVQANIFSNLGDNRGNQIDLTKA